MYKLSCRNLTDLYGRVADRKAMPLTIKVQSFTDPTRWWMFASKSLYACRAQIASMLCQLPSEMMQSSGLSGYPWFLAIKRGDGTRWGDIEDADKLLAIGRAASMVNIHKPMRECDVPFCVILNVDINLRAMAMELDNGTK